MDNREISRTELAKHLGIAYNTLLLKINGKRPFTILEASKISDLLELTNEQKLNIFFNENVA